ncbi:hypothetical protein N9928_01175 [bacterium]|nr:hypothetical protein [bacterium]
MKEKLPNVLIDINGVVSKQDNSVISEQECSEIMDSFLEILEDKGYCYSGGYFLTDENLGISTNFLNTTKDIDSRLLESMNKLMRSDKFKEPTKKRF